jgi:hypothetical protein
MASDNKYYNRREKRIEAMEDYQVRDSFNRKTSPDLHASFVPVVDYQKQFTKENCWSVKSMLYIENHSNTPAQYYAVKLFLNWRIDLIVTPSSYTSTNTIVQTPTGGSFKAHHFQWIKGIPGSFPVWKGTPLSFDELYLGIPEEYVGSELDFCWEISAPGMETKKYYGKLRMAGNLLMEVNQHE